MAPARRKAAISEMGRYAETGVDNVPPPVRWSGIPVLAGDYRAIIQETKTAIVVVEISYAATTPGKERLMKLRFISANADENTLNTRAAARAVADLATGRDIAIPLEVVMASFTAKPLAHLS